MTMAIGKRKLILDVSSVDPSQERGEQFWVLPPNASNANMDLFRHSSYNIWGLLKKGPNANLNDLHYLKGRGKAPYKIIYGKPSIDESNIFPLVTQTITLTADRSKFNGSGWPAWWEKYIKGGTYTGKNNSQIQDQTILPGIIVTDVEYTDHTFEIQAPYDEKELGAYSNIGKPVQIKIESVYNFYNEQYEIASGDPSIPEAILPNLYVFTSYKDNSHSEDINPAYADFITLKNNLPNNVLQLRGREIRNRYYDKWSSQVPLLGPLTYAELGSKGGNSALPLAEVKKFNHYSEMRSEFPMYVNLSFSTDTETKFADMLEASKLDVAFLSDVMKETIPDITSDMITTPMVEMNENPFLQKTDLGGTVVKKNPTVENVLRRSLDITQWMTKFIVFNEATSEMQLVEDTSKIFAGVQEQVNRFATFLGATLENDSIMMNPKYEPFKRLMIMIFSGKLRKLIKNNFRTFEETLSGKLAYSETVLYRIAKFDINGSLLQNIYIPNSSDIDIFNFVDTQVKHDKDYTYTIYAYQAVIGTKYEYFNAFAGAQDQGAMEVESGQKNTTAKFTVAYEPSVKLFEVPYHSTKCIVLDAPPLIPDVDIIPYRGKDNKIQIRLNGSTGRYSADPIIIEQEDHAMVNRLREAFRLDEDDPMTFFADDFVAFFQVFRTTTKPRSYSDMRGKIHTTINTDISAQTPQRANSAEMNDLIEPNRKYYYMFRAVDRHGHISNPTTIYEVELVKQNESVYSVISVAEDFAQPVKDSTKGMRRYLHIKPNIANSLIDRVNLGVSERIDGADIERIKLGVTEERIWGKKFKIRLISKNSGKKIDFNLDFTTKHIKPGDG
jgi:hypothetical protein